MKSRIFPLIFSVFIASAGLLLAASLAYAGGGGGSSGGSSSGQNTQARPGTHAVTSDRATANAVAREMNSNPRSMPNNHEAVVTSNRDGTVSVSVRERERSDGNSSSGGTPTRPTDCTATPNLQTIDIFFVPAGAQPAVNTSRAGQNNSFSSIIRSVLSNTNPYQQSILPRNELEVGVSYDPIAVIRNTANCTSGSQVYHQYGGGGGAWVNTIQSLLRTPVVYAGGSTASRAPQPNDYPNNFRSQSPFGSNGSFPVRGRIDVGNNATYEWSQYLNAIGPVTNGSTYYLKLPVFSTNEIGTHTLEVVTDIRHSIDPGRGCFASSTPASSGWGCVRESNERDNDRSETFTTRATTTSLIITPDVADVTVARGQILSQIPFVAINNGNAIIRDYQYRVTVNGNVFASTTRTTSLTPTNRETVQSSGLFTAPVIPTSLPLRVCARVGTSTESCDMARLVVVTPECSDGQDNDADGRNDATDPGCYTDPTDPTTYDPNDTTEGDTPALVPPTITLDSRPEVVQFNQSATLEYTVTANYPIVCALTGGGETQSITHTPPRTVGMFTTRPLQGTVTFTLSCSPNVPGVTGTPTTVTETVQVIPRAQET